MTSEAGQNGVARRSHGLPDEATRGRQAAAGRREAEGLHRHTDLGLVQAQVRPRGQNLQWISGLGRRPENQAAFVQPSPASQPEHVHADDVDNDI